MFACFKSRWLLLAALWSLLLTASAACAKSSKEFERRYAAGQRLYETGEYDKALVELEAAFQLDPLPQLLINMGRCHYKADRPEEALALYRRALDMKLDRREREELSKSIDRATIRLAEKQKTLSLHAPPPASPIAQPVIVDARRNDEAEQPLYKKGWFWGVIFGSAAVVGVGIGLAVARPWERAPIERPADVITY